MKTTYDECPFCGQKMTVLRNDNLEFRARCDKNHIIVMRKGLEEN